ncbi:GAF domain-containing protein [Ramlibacter sp. XY19]|uniref:GAF domain-containing protein n=1 Tax=Ramlibacter paludis TaxID=2908000 RepID=UPI0023D9EB2E|nr:GAF domain-containing protein [Ramlibacter paludis]MCG2592278.1 GAF domain-containing protein [Ramlibacter paludis]
MSYRDGASDARSSLLLAGQNQALQLALSGAALEEVLALLVQTAETQSDGAFLGSILLLDEEGKHLRHGAAPSLPAEYNEAIDGIAIGPSVGSCGTAAHFGHAIVVTDIERDPLWAGFKDLALAHGLRACWSTPFLSKEGTVLGTLALYYREPRGPSENDRETVRLIGGTAGLVVENARLHAQLQDLNHRARLAADAGGLGFFTWEIGSDAVSWQNDRPYAIFGIAPSEGPIDAKRFVSEFLHPDDQQAFADAVTQVLENGSRFHFLGRIRQQSTGDIRRVEFTGQLDEAARERGIARVVGIVADRT